LELRTGYDFRTARRSLNFLLGEWANRGINLWTIEEGSINLVQGQTTYDLPNDTVDLDWSMLFVRIPDQGPNQTDINISRISVSTYSTIPNKLAQGRPIQVWINRQSGQTTDLIGATSANPQINVWPTPDQGTQLNPYYVFYYWRLKRIFDAGDGVNVPDIPFRFQNCLVAGLAYMIAVKKPDVAPDRLMGLKMMYDEAWDLASQEDREKAPDRFVPREYYIS
jgi:hypothetical protein